jgi:hypothetical protein
MLRRVSRLKKVWKRAKVSCWSHAHEAVLVWGCFRLVIRYRRWRGWSAVKLTKGAFGITLWPQDPPEREAHETESGDHVAH